MDPILILCTVLQIGMKKNDSLMSIFSDITNSIVVPEIMIPDLSEANANVLEQKDLFEIHKKGKWHSIQTLEARCDLKKKVRLQKRGVYFTSVWQKSLFGRTLTELKEDRDMPRMFASEIVQVIREMMGEYQDPKCFAVVCSPRRRHIDWNFGHETASIIADSLGLEFFRDCCKAKNRQRVNAEFEPYNVPPHSNLIVYDDIVTSGQTLSSMHRLFSDRLGKNCIFFANINNKL